MSVCVGGGWMDQSCIVSGKKGKFALGERLMGIGKHSAKGHYCWKSKSRIFYYNGCPQPTHSTSTEMVGMGQV